MAIKPTRAWMDSTGAFHAVREDACKAEFRRLLQEKFAKQLAGGVDSQWIGIEQLVDNMFDIDRMFGEATKEDTRVEFAGADVDGK